MDHLFSLVFPLFYLQNFAQILISTFLHESSSPKLLAICLLWLSPHSSCSLKGFFFFPFFWFVCLFICFSVPLCRGRQLVKCWECNPDFLMLSWAFSLLYDPNFGQSSNVIYISLSVQFFKFNISSLDLVLTFCVMLISALR